MSEHSIVIVVLAIFALVMTAIGTLLTLGIKKTLNEMSAIWEEIKEIQAKQLSLRERLPTEYLRIDGPGYGALHDGIERIEKTFNRFAQDCRDGKCIMGRHKKDKPL